MPRITGGQALTVQMTAAPGGQPAPANKNKYTGGRRQYAGPTDDDPRFFNEVKPGVAAVPIYGALAKNPSFMMSCAKG